MTQTSPTSNTYWDPTQYLRFSDQRLRPALELMERVPLEAPRLVYDLGCGPGNVTGILAQRWPGAAVYGVDNSREMLAQASKASADVQWIEADIRTWTPDEPANLIYSNATLQWLDGHASLFPRLAGLVQPGGCLAVQMPLSWPQPSHRLIRETLATGGPSGTPLGSAAVHAEMNRNWVEPAETYYDLLSPHAKSIDIWETEYLQVLAGDDPVLEWVKGTTLRPIIDGLSDAERTLFLSTYGQHLREAYPKRADGSTLYPFRRLFIVAQF